MIFLPSARYVAACEVLARNILALAALVPPIVSADMNNSLLDNSTLSTRIESEWAVFTKDTRTQKLQLMIEPELEMKAGEDSSITTIARLRTDAKNNLSPSDHSQAELREFYLDTSIKDSIVMLGKQQVVWGKSDGLKVLDIVNPQDFREFILDDFDQSRIPLWTVNAEIPINNVTLQLLLIPDQSYHEFATPGSSYPFTSPIIIPPTPAGANVLVKPTITPDKILQDADAGFRLSTFTHGWDLTFNYLYHYDDTPVIFRTINNTTAGLNISITPQYKRTHLIGGTFSNTFGDLTLRGEVGYLSDRYIPTNNPLDNDGVVNTGEFKYVIGFDWYGLSNTLLSTQLFQTYLNNHEAGMIQEKLNTKLTFLIKQEYMNETLHAEILFLHDLDYEDGMLRPKLSYEYNDKVNIYAGADIFYGSKDGLFGQFKETDRIVSGIIIGF
ncbi:hypothetical protein MNBD_GAMMA05-161 [hydrothermal vent metagenome]|uniref:Alginate export domain-containing protein n=1 Tax=hydrothermal vent metagenome TaxID=652676 RepID=A0A3B0WAK3_9ZZZZ